MKMKLIVAALAALLVSGAAHAGMSLHADDPWARAVRDQHL